LPQNRRLSGVTRQHGEWGLTLDWLGSAVSVVSYFRREHGRLTNKCLALAIHESRLAFFVAQTISLWRLHCES